MLSYDRTLVANLRYGLHSHFFDKLPCGYDTQNYGNPPAAS